MYLKRLEILGFKTFAARTVLEFRPGITAIVGPNGSGKSNILDAVRWVLGEQSFAALRSKRAEDLIFAGGARRAPSGFAEVALTIDNSDRLLPLPYNEVTFGRRATRAGESEYLINRQRVRLRDLHEAIGPLGGSYTIINQGLVDAALNLRPEDRRRLFEDAAEIGIYEQRKTDSERRLRETAANIQRCDDVLADLEPRLRSLKRQAALARSFREAQAELHALLWRSYTAQRRAAQLQLAAAEQALNQSAQDLAAAHADQAAAQAEVQALRDSLRHLREQLQTLHTESSTLHDQAEAIQRDLAVSNERAAALDRRSADLERQRHDLDLRASELERDQAETAARMQAAELRLAEQRTLLQQHEQLLAGRATERRSARQALDTAQRAELHAAAALAEAQRRTAQIEQRRSQLLAERAALAPALAIAQRLAEQRRTDIAQAEQAVADATAQFDRAQQAGEQARGAIEAARTSLAAADERLAQARRALADAEARLESLNRLQRSYTGAFAGVRAAMQWAEAQQIPGFILVSTIIRTPAEIETAIEVALGSRIQNIVVEAWQDAEAAIEALKRSNAGRATFLPLDTIRRTQRDERIQADAAGVLGVAADLVDYDDHYAIVAWHLLGRTLIVRDLPTARRELRTVGGGWTIVTLAGEQVNAGGAVTGGAQIRESGTLRRERELRELPRQVADLRRAVEAAQQERSQAEATLMAAEQARRTAEQNRRMAQQELDLRRDLLDRARRSAVQAESDLALQGRRDTQIEQELHDLEQQALAVQAEHTALIEREAATRQQVEQLRAAEQAQHAIDQADQERLAQVRTVLSAAEGELRAERALAQAHTQNLSRIATQREDLERRVAEQIAERAALLERTQGLESAHAALLNQIDALRRQIDPAEHEVAGGEAAQAEQEQRAAQATNQLLEREAAHNRTQLEAQRARDRLDTLWERAAADDIDLDTLDTAAEPEPDVEPTEGLPDQIQALRTRIQRLGTVNPLALEEYEEVSTRVDFLSSQLNDLRAAERSLNELISELDQAMQTRFEATFQAVAAEFERTFEQLFGGGQARLILTRPDGEEATDRSSGFVGVDIIARPPGKRQQNLALLSGGERSLTAVALLFSILKVNPSPFCVLDEVDAALDEANVGRFRDALIGLSHQTQFLVITHNRGTIEAADTIYGVSVGEDSSAKVLSLRLEELGVE
ncbi:MAG: chromosome segregation protein SMC [Roseiflexaceae bacterium]